MIIGYATSISFPLIGYFDEWEYTTMHYILAAIFFVSSVLYTSLLSFFAYRNRSEF